MLCGGRRLDDTAAFGASFLIPDDGRYGLLFSVFQGPSIPLFFYVDLN